MGQLVQYEQEPRTIEPPPDDSIEGAAWVAKLLRRELHGVVSDRGLSTSDRRDLVVKFSRAIITATPNHELYDARKALREDEEEEKDQKLRGKVTGASTSGARHLRADAPRRRRE